MRPALISLALTLCACAEDAPAGDGPRIAAVAPDPADPGALLRITGDGFGEAARGAVAIGGRPARPTTWGDHGVTVLVPADMAGGETYVVVTVDGRPSAPVALAITGDNAPPSPPRRFPGGGDGGLRPDASPPSDGGPARDGGRPDAGRTLVAEYLPDPVAGDGVRITTVDRAPGQLTLQVSGPVAWGAAFHLTYDRNILRFDAMLAPAPNSQRHAGEIAPDRLGFGRVFGGSPSPDWAILRFTIVGVGETRLDFPRRHRTVRAEPERAQAVRWTGGSVRVVEVTP